MLPSATKRLPSSSAFFTGLAGYVFALNNGIVEPASFDFSLSLFFFAAVIVGGLASVWGPLAGAAVERVLAVFPPLRTLLGRRGGLLSGGEQQMLAIARAIMVRPRLLLMDEPSLGLAPLLTRQVFDSLAEINRLGTTILLVEQNAAMALDLAAYGLVLVNGAVDLAGRAEELMATDRVRLAYLGG